MSNSAEPLASIAQPFELAQGCAVHETFRSWPHTTPSAQAMINAGFAMVEDTYDGVRCLGCQVCLDNWHLIEDPLAVHLIGSANCEVAKTMKRSSEKRQEAVLLEKRSTTPIHTVAANGPSSPATSATSSAAGAAVFTPPSSTIAPPSSSATRHYRLLHFTKGRKGPRKWHLTLPTSKGMPLDASRADFSNAYNPFRMLEQGFHTGVLEAGTEVVGEKGATYGWCVFTKSLSP